MKTIYDLSKLNWSIEGWTPYYWRLKTTSEVGASPDAEISAIPAKVPGSVQYALREAGIIPDWNCGLNARECEWVENRHWIYTANIPDEWIEKGRNYKLNCQGLDYCGRVLINGIEAGEFCNTFVPHIFDITPHLADKDNRIQIVFELPPRWLGQFGFTERMKEWKARFYYTWDWVARIVQIGIWDSIFLEATSGAEITEFRCFTDADLKSSTGMLTILGEAIAPQGSKIKIALRDNNNDLILADELELDDFNSAENTWEDFEVSLWWPNLHGDQPLYTLDVVLADANGNELDFLSRRVGFKHVEWAKNENAPEDADPWICVVNGKPIFIQGANWVPILPNFADVTAEDYRKRLELYKSLGFNTLRVWGGAILEKTVFYELCDDLGIMVWQEFPLSSSGGSSYPPDDEDSIKELANVAKSYITRRQHHASLLLWSGGNELTKEPNSDIPADSSHPLLAELGRICAEMDPAHRYIATSPTGPKGYAHEENYGRGLHWDVHGPWKPGLSLKDWEKYWSNDDSLFRSETGAPGASPVDIINKYAGDCDTFPATYDNPYWKRGSTWWIEWPQFCEENGRQPDSLEEYVNWSQERQKNALIIAARACKSRFPACGGIIFWMGHDCFPCAANTSIIDFHGNPKPAAIAIGEIFKEEQ